jgi:3-deoxy-D-manno-octulosonate 8-phosphate phosphatase (KDO 8-P phosphatase)
MINVSSDEWLPKTFILDVDGVFTDGKIYCSSEGKLFKVFGPDDHDALKLIQGKLQIVVVSADRRGFHISRRRIEDDMGLDLHLVGSRERVDWITERYKPNECVYMGDGIFDPLVFKIVGYSIAPNNASLRTQAAANFVTSTRGSEGAVAEASLHLIDRFYGGFEISNLNIDSGI